MDERYSGCCYSWSDQRCYDQRCCRNYNNQLLDEHRLPQHDGGDSVPSAIIYRRFYRDMQWLNHYTYKCGNRWYLELKHQRDRNCWRNNGCCERYFYRYCGYHLLAWFGLP